VGGGPATEAKGTSDDENKFSLYSDKDGVKISVGKMVSSTIVVVMGSCEVPAGADEFLNFIMHQNSDDYNAFMHEADAMYVDGRILSRYEGRGCESDATRINVPGPSRTVIPTRCDYWSVFRLPWPLWWRDFTYREVTNKAFLSSSGAWRISAGPEDIAAPGETSYVYIASTSFERESTPELEASHKFVRGNNAVAGYVLATLPDSTVDAPKSRLYYLALVDAKGSLPGLWA
jgi:hypothetical protein